MTRRVLIVDSGDAQGERLARECRTNGFEVDVIPNELALAHLSMHGSEYDSLVVRATDEPSNLSSADRMGEFVLRYVAQALPQLLLRTVVVTTLPEGGRNFPGVRTIVEEPYELEPWFAELLACCEEL